MTEMKSNDEILDAVYIHGTREKDAPGSRCNIPELPPDELTIATALKMLDQKDRAKDSRIQSLEKELSFWKRVYATDSKALIRTFVKNVELESKLESADTLRKQLVESNGCLKVLTMEHSMTQERREIIYEVTDRNKKALESYDAQTRSGE